MLATRCLAFTFGCALIACGDEAQDPRDTTPDVADTTADTTMTDTLAPETTDDTIDPIDAGDTIGPEVVDTIDAIDDSAPEVVEPVACDPDSACNMLLDDAGLCAGECFPIPPETTCLGEVQDGICRRATVVWPDTVETDFGDFTVTPIAWPDDLSVGDSGALEVQVTNDTDRTLTIPFHTKDPGTFTFTDPSWVGLTEIVLAPHASLSLTADATARYATVLHGAGIVVTFNFDGNTFEPWSKVHFADSEPIACGGQHFPATWCWDPESCYSSSSFYMSAVCCDDVFYPGGTCCSDADCVGGGGCIDQKCVTYMPGLTSANSLPLGNQRILMVVLEQFDGISFDPCADRVDELGETYQLDVVDGWFHELAERRFGARTMATKWEIRGGMLAADVLQDGDGNDYATLQQRLDDYMQDNGCSGVIDTYDKVIIASSSLDLFGFGGIYNTNGEIFVLNANMPYLLAHELAHSFGATDLYNDIAGGLRYLLSLMGNNVQGSPYPEDLVAWGELGYADNDQNGVLDVAEFAAFPEALVIRDATATITTKNTLEVKWRFLGVERDGEKRVVLDQFDIATGNGALVLFSPGAFKTAVFDTTMVDLEALRAAGHVLVHVAAELPTTTRDWERRVLTVDETLDIDVDIEE